MSSAPQQRVRFNTGEDIHCIGEWRVTDSQRERCTSTAAEHVKPSGFDMRQRTDPQARDVAHDSAPPNCHRPNRKALKARKILHGRPCPPSLRCTFRSPLGRSIFPMVDGAAYSHSRTGKTSVAYAYRSIASRKRKPRFSGSSIFGRLSRTTKRKCRFPNDDSRAIDSWREDDCLGESV